MEKYESKHEGSTSKKVIKPQNPNSEAQHTKNIIGKIHNDEDTDDYLDSFFGVTTNNKKDPSYIGVRATVFEGKSTASELERERYKILINDYKAKFLVRGIKLMLGYREIDEELKNHKSTLTTVSPEELVNSLATLETQLSLYPSSIFLALGQVKIILTEGYQTLSHEVDQGSSKSAGFYVRNKKCIVTRNITNVHSLVGFHHEMFHCLEHEYDGESDNPVWDSLGSGQDLEAYGAGNVQEDQATVAAALWTYPLGLLQICAKGNTILTEKVKMITGCDIDFTTMRFVDKPGRVGEYYRKWNDSFDASFWNKFVVRPLPDRVKKIITSIWDGEDLVGGSHDHDDSKPVLPETKPKPTNTNVSTLQGGQSPLLTTSKPIVRMSQKFKDLIAARDKAKTPKTK